MRLFVAAAVLAIGYAAGQYLVGGYVQERVEHFVKWDRANRLERLLPPDLRQ